MMTPRRDERVSEHPVEEHVDAHALPGLGNEPVFDALAQAVVVDHLVREQGVIPRLFDTGQDAVKGGLALLSVGSSAVAIAYECSATGAVDENANDNDLFDAVACGPGATVR